MDRNIVSLDGRVCKDIELKHLENQNATAYCQFTLAVNDHSKNGQGDTDFIRCIAWQNRAETLVRYVKKGHQVGIDGRLKIRSFKDKQGNNVSIAEVLVNQIYFRDNRKSDNNEQVVEQKPTTNTQNSYNTVEDDEYPF